MKLLLLNIIFVLSLNTDLGNIGRYEIELQTKNGDIFEVNFVIATYDNLETEFTSKNEFKKFLFNIYGVEHLDSLKFFKDFHYVNYPEYKDRKEKLTAILKEDWITISKSDIVEMKFKSLEVLDYIGLATQLKIDEIKLLQSEPNFMNAYSIDAYQEVHTQLWLLSYNDEINEKDLNQVVHQFKEKYSNKTIEGEHDKNSWIYREMINNWQKELKTKEILLIEVSRP